jgi:hypothetical protein
MHRRRKGQSTESEVQALTLHCVSHHEDPYIGNKTLFSDVMALPTPAFCKTISLIEKLICMGIIAALKDCLLL